METDYKEDEQKHGVLTSLTDTNSASLLLTRFRWRRMGKERSPSYWNQRPISAVSEKEDMLAIGKFSSVKGVMTSLQLLLFFYQNSSCSRRRQTSPLCRHLANWTRHTHRL